MQPHGLNGCRLLCDQMEEFSRLRRRRGERGGREGGEEREREGRGGIGGEQNSCYVKESDR